jgi:hypothetical protein
MRCLRLRPRFTVTPDSEALLVQHAAQTGGRRLPDPTPAARNTAGRTPSHAFHCRNATPAHLSDHAANRRKSYVTQDRTVPGPAALLQDSQ